MGGGGGKNYTEQWNGVRVTSYIMLLIVLYYNGGFLAVDLVY